MGCRTIIIRSTFCLWPNFTNFISNGVSFCGIVSTLRLNLMKIGRKVMLFGNPLLPVY
jgi:hypothetical protein